MEVRVADHPLAAARLTWSEMSSKSARPAKDFESWETVSIAERAQFFLVRCRAQLPSRERHRLIATSTPLQTQIAQPTNPQIRPVEC